ncbi:MAG TPA: septal ring lytic transglycosylase RlpA family protein [Coleofasciculaceae cyanobacterium]|jgi:rare lipoprotein A
MNQKFLSGFTAALLIATLGSLPSYADQSGSQDESLAVNVPAESTSSSQEVANPIHQTAEAHEAQPHEAEASLASSQSQPGEAVKVGEYQSQDLARPEETIAIIYPHQLGGQQAATLYVRNIPVLTFLASESANSTSAPSVASAVVNEEAAKPQERSADVKVASIQNSSLNDSALAPQSTSGVAGNVHAAVNTNDPVWRATEISARLNQLHQNSVDASSINVTWDDQKQQYVIKVGDDVLVAMDAATILPNTTENPSEDALQATNLIRRQMGNAPPITQIPGRPQTVSTLSLGSVQFRISGWASWYGPGFDGNYSASGEIFDQNALTAAHPDLPFGTQVRVTNMDNGMSVVVRINDRGPYAGDRVIDLSQGAASVIGLVQSGVAPVSLEVLGAATAAR